MESTGSIDRAAVRSQLERMLADPLFKHSKRYPALLRYVVERTLDDANADLKERTLGVAVFGRDPAYDTSADPVVRATAGEIRKRIAQYYQEAGHERELRINLSPGSYVPEFAMAQPPAEEPAPAPPAARTQRNAWLAGAAVAVLALAALLLWKPWSGRTALDQFWRPVLDSSNSVLLCIGQRRFAGIAPEPDTEASPDIERVRKELAGPDSPASLFRLYYLGSQNLSLHDVTAFGNIAGLLRAHGKAYHLRAEQSTSLADLRDGPVVLIGALNNDWTMRLIGQLRFNFSRRGDIFWIQDRQNPRRTEWAIDYSTPYLKLSADYAIISRAIDPTTERMVVSVGGITGYGTMAAAEFLSNPAYLAEAARNFPGGWARKNVQLVISTRVINGNSGPPRVVDQHFW